MATRRHIRKPASSTTTPHERNSGRSAPGRSAGRQALSRFVLAAGGEYHLQLPEEKALAEAVLDFWYDVQPIALVEEMHLGYHAQERACTLLALLLTDWRPWQSPEPHAPTPQEQRHRLLTRTKLDIWHRYPELLFDVYPANPRRFPSLDAKGIFARVVPAGTMYLGALPLSIAPGSRE